MLCDDPALSIGDQSHDDPQREFYLTALAIGRSRIIQT
jgi:hypothetical protein